MAVCVCVCVRVCMPPCVYPNQILIFQVLVSLCCVEDGHSVVRTVCSLLLISVMPPARRSRIRFDIIPLPLGMSSPSKYALLTAIGTVSVCDSKLAVSSSSHLEEFNVLSSKKTSRES